MLDCRWPWAVNVIRCVFCTDDNNNNSKNVTFNNHLIVFVEAKTHLSPAACNGTITPFNTSQTHLALVQQIIIIINFAYIQRQMLSVNRIMCFGNQSNCILDGNTISISFRFSLNPREERNVSTKYSWASFTIVKYVLVLHCISWTFRVQENGFVFNLYLLRLLSFCII